MASKPPYISVADAAEETGISVRRLQEAIKYKALRATKLSDRITSAYLIKRSDLDAYLAKRDAL